MPENDITRLPRWAQNEIERLRRSLAAEEAKNEAVQAGATEVYVLDYGRERAEESRAYLPAGSTIAFLLPYRGRDGYRASVRVQVRGDQVEVTSQQGALSVHPKVSNSIGVTVERNLVDDSLDACKD